MQLFLPTDLQLRSPRPQLERDNWFSLDGDWAFALDPDGDWREPSDVRWDATICVPFAPETAESGIGKTGFYRACWYRRSLPPPPLPRGGRLMLHFEAVDYNATVWANGVKVGEHQGGYSPFSVDLTRSVKEGEAIDLVVRAEDDPLELAKPRGKQDWQLEPHSIWYPRTTGIWQPVWLEVLPPTWIAKLRWTPTMERWEMGVEAHIDGERRERLRLHVTLQARDRLMADDTYSVVGGEVHRRIALSDPGIDDSRNELLWSPHSPTLVEAVLELWGDRGELLDVVRSYTALRSIAAEGDRLLLNGRPYMLRLVLDQGYWRGSGLTAPNDAALKRDVELVKQMGFNGVRKHQKVESQRYLYWADVLGLLVWEEMPSAYRFTRESVERLVREWTAVIDRDYSHPSIIAWVPFNESWGVPNLPSSASERHYVQALYHLTRTIDPTRLVVGNDGWESVATDIIGVHDYDPEPDRIARRYQAEETRERIFRRERPGGRALVLGGHTGQPMVLTEFGGIACGGGDDGTWGYCRAQDGAEFAQRYSRLLAAVNNLPNLAGFCYTQFTDTYQEANGLLHADRTPKFPIHVIQRATLGLAAETEPQ